MIHVRMKCGRCDVFDQDSRGWWRRSFNWKNCMYLYCKHLLCVYHSWISMSWMVVWFAFIWQRIKLQADCWLLNVECWWWHHHHNRRRGRQKHLTRDNKDFTQLDCSFGSLDRWRSDVFILIWSEECAVNDLRM